MILWYICLHVLAYFPSTIFINFTAFWDFLTGNVSHALRNWKDYQYCAFILVVVCTVYPIVTFIALLHDGFHVYDDLTKDDMKVDGGLVGKLLYTFRVVLHIYMICITVYLIAMCTYVVILRTNQKYPGQYVW